MFCLHGRMRKLSGIVHKCVRHGYTSTISMA